LSHWFTLKISFSTSVSSEEFTELFFTRVSLLLELVKSVRWLCLTGGFADEDLSIEYVEEICDMNSRRFRGRFRLYEVVIFESDVFVVETEMLEIGAMDPLAAAGCR